jgi:signal transduction histidine kinase
MAGWKGRYEAPVAIALVLLVGITVLSIYRSSSIVLTHSTSVNVAITTATLVVALGAAYFALTEFVLYGLVASLLVGIGFLLLADSSLSSGLLPLLHPWFAGQEVGAAGWATLRVVGGALLVVAALYREASVPGPRRLPILTVIVGGALGLALMMALWPSVSGAPEPPEAVGRGIQGLAAALFFVAAALFWRAGELTGRAWFSWLALSFVLGGFAQVNYAIVTYPPSVVQVGDILRFLFFTGIVVALTGEWGRAFWRLRAQTRELAVLHELMMAPAVQSPDDVVNHATAVAAEALQGEARITLGAIPPVADAGACAGPLQNGQSSATSDDPSGAERTLAAPLFIRGEAVGRLLVSRPRGRPFNSRDVSLIGALAAQTGMLIERSSLYQEVAAGAVLEERSRLAREIHDGLAQHLAFLKMRVQWLQRSPSRVTEAHLRDMEGVLTSALAEARHAITTLRSDATSMSVADAIVSYAEEFGRVANFDLRVSREPQVPDVAPQARVELLRIVQEALNNARKHACAHAVDLRLGAIDELLRVEIKDDGAGFETGVRQEGHFGLEIMRERAAAIGGRLEVCSRPGAGTTVVAYAPASPPTGDSS